MFCSRCGHDMGSVELYCSKCGAPRPSLVQAGHAKPPRAAAPIGERLGYLMLVVPVISTVLIVVWIGSMNLLQGPGSWLWILSFTTIITTGILAGIEAAQLGMGAPNDERPRGFLSSSPLAWALVVMLVWIVGYPAYLYWRSRYGMRNLIVGGIAVCVIYLIVVGAMASVIDARVEQVRSTLSGHGPTP